MSAALMCSTSRFNRVQVPSVEILHQLSATMSHFKKRYAFPSLETIRAGLSMCHRRKVSIRTLIRHLNGLEGDGMIERVQRHRKVQGKGMEMHSTLYKLTAKAWRWISRLSGAVGFAVSWGKERVTHVSQYKPSTRENNTEAALGGPPNSNKEPPDGGAGKKPASTLDTQRQINATKPTATGFSTLQFLKRSLNHGPR